MALVTAATAPLSIAAAVLTAILVSSSLEPAAADKDADALTALRRGLHDPDGALASWDPTLVNACTWFYVTCDGNNRVTRLDLGRLKLSGPLAPQLGLLERLQYLEIYGNNIQGRIPSELGGLRNLVGLDLHGNRISGPIPLALGNLKDLSSNSLCGTIPTTGAFKNIPPRSFAKNPRLHQGGKYEPNC
ncbi:Somatic embryogenesis receptor kinase 1 [Dichanthelium oligosanthes]|uniref:Somatic embryogenesis receptor kinase 1 n=1 Tax=Dichanthelium oligosanthes TaxID=888268 RepID=A0A1E5VTK4_9POAL|nr:Somatic embryogenesis receptor kinase 1 [Dichanthelium oligosanthes]